MKQQQTLALLLAAGVLAGCGGNADHAASNSTTVVAQSRMSDVASASVAADKVARLSGNRADYSVTNVAGVVTVTQTGGDHTATELTGVVRLIFADGILALDTTGVPAKVYRLYQAAFDRSPDLGGLGFQIAMVEGFGLTIDQVAAGFIASPEFVTKYGALDDASFVTQLYLNILHRAPDAGGKAFWLDQMSAHGLSRAGVLGYFADSPENVALVAPSIEAGIRYEPYVTAGAATAVTVAGSANTVAWNADTPLSVSLRSAHQVDVMGKNLHCTATDPTRLTVAADCSSAKGYRLGNQQVTLSADGLTATLTLRIVPQRQALGTQGNARYHNLVTTPGGEVMAWGYNSNNALAQGGPAPGTNNWFNLPVYAKNADGSGHLSAIMAASFGELDAMALTDMGNVLGWAGAHDMARTTKSSNLPSLVRNAANDASLANIVQVEVGQGNAVALSDDGQVWTWGSYPGHTGSSAPFPNHPAFASGATMSNVVQVAAGGDYGLALDQNGKVYGWGWNHSGQMGRGDNINPANQVAAVRLASDDTELSNIVAISAGYNFALALAADGRVYAWGDSSYGQTGQGVRGTEFLRAVPVKDVAGTGLLGNIVMVAAGGHHAYVLDKDGRVWTWGLNNSHELGEGSNGGVSEALLPRAVVNVDSTGQLDNVVSIAAGYEHGLALRGDGSVLVWGNGFGGNLGQGNDTWTSRAVPTTVKLGSGTLVLKPLSAYQNLLRRGR